ncbi:serine/arginine repetitive matrix protein 2 isoform X2 [Phyllopteryx taeniolatus]|nr:serine/arginine repetitive matrix protein 2 isoform X2 [Phyllopteryx taeniolatus]
MALNLADALKSAKILKEAVKSDHVFQKHLTRSKSQSRSPGRGRSRGKSRVRSRSRGRGISQVRGKSRARNKSRARSRSKSRKSRARSKSRQRRSSSRSSSPSHIDDYNNASCSTDLRGSSLLEGLKMVMRKKEMGDQLPSLKDAILTIEASNKSNKLQCLYNKQQHDTLATSTSLENDSMLLPHDRVGSDFSWLQPQSQTARKADQCDDEELFLYGDEKATKEKVDYGTSTTCMTGELVQPKCDEIMTCEMGSLEPNCDKSNFRILNGLSSSSQVFANLDNNECEKIKNILNSLGKKDSSVMEKQVSSEPLSCLTTASLGLISSHSPNVQQALESLRSLIKATKEKRETGDPVGTSLSSYNKHKLGDDSERNNAKQTKITKTEMLMKEVGELLKEDGFSFLIPVIGFYCQICEEFIGDLRTAETHAANHCHNKIDCKTLVNKHTEETKGHTRYSSSSSKHHPTLSDRQDHRGHSYTDRGDDKYENHYNRRHDGDHRIKQEEDDRGHRPGQESNLFEMKKEKMLITVSGCLASTNVKEELNKDHDIESHAKVKEEAAYNGKSKDVSEKDANGKNESSHDSSNDHKKGSKVKSHKKKKKKEKKRDKKDKKKKKDDLS